MPIVSCKRCKSEFYTKPNWLKIGHGKYCSRICSATENRKGKEVKCYLCQRLVYKSLKDLKKSKSGKYFCSKECSIKWLNGPRNGKQHHCWKSGLFSYRGILEKSGLAASCLRCGKNDKRILVVHHKDENRKNNKLNNLVWLCFNCHFLVHHYEIEKKVFDENIVRN